MLRLTVLGLCFLGLCGTAEAKSVKKGPAAPQMAAMGLAAASAPHTCTMSYQGCLKNCKSTTGADCAKECDADCDVCSLDFGEETKAICK